MDNKRKVPITLSSDGTKDPHDDDEKRAKREMILCYDARLCYRCSSESAARTQSLSLLLPDMAIAWTVSARSEESRGDRGTGRGQEQGVRWPDRHAETRGRDRDDEYNHLHTRASGTTPSLPPHDEDDDGRQMTLSCL